MIRTKLGMILGTGAAVLAIGIFGGIRSANAAVMSPQIDKQIRPYIALGFGGNDGYQSDCGAGYNSGYVGVDVPIYVGGHRYYHRDWDRDRDFHRDWNRDGDHDRGRDFRGANRDDHGGWGHR
jgi:hypothetical protein